MTKPLISVIIPVYKMEAYLSRCLDSVATQTYENLEVLLVDDGSPDNCGTICDMYAAKDHRFRVLHTENSGAFAARNRALDITTGDYVGFVDADDWLEPTMYDVLLQLAENTHADIVQCEMCNEGAYSQIRNSRQGGVVMYSGTQLTRELFRENISHGLLNKLFRREIFVARRFPEGYYHMDAAFMATVGQFCKTFARTDDVLYHYNTTNPSITRGRKKNLHIASAKKLFEIYSTVAKDLPEGSYFICREIPSFGRLILPGRKIPLPMAVDYIRYMHRIFERHWTAARRAEEYQTSPKAKRVLWNIYHRTPLLASVLVYVYGRSKGTGQKKR